jgi:protein-disulfide isomerase
MNDTKNIFELLPPRQSFIFGVVSGLLLICSVGFLIMLGLMSKGKLVFVGGGSAPLAVAPTGANQPVPAAPAIGTVRAVDTQKDHIRGNKNAKVTIITYTDLECPFCKRFHITMNAVMKTYSDKVRWVYRQMPLAQLHSQATQESLASECAGEQGKFWEFVDIVFDATPSNDGLDLAKLPDYAKQAGVRDIAKFNSCITNNTYGAKIQSDLADGESAGAQGTPYSVVIAADGTKTAVNGAQPQAAVEAALAAALK